MQLSPNALTPSSSAKVDDPEALMTAPAVCALLSIVPMTLARWIADQRKNFPAPIYLGRRRYFRRSEVLGWVEAQASKQAAE